MRYRITIERIETRSEPPDHLSDSEQVMQVYQQTFEELNVAEMITRLNHQPRRRNAKKVAKA